MCEVKITNLYKCPICKKQYRRKGYYLNAHLKKCRAIAWIPEIRIEITTRKLEEDKLAEAVEKLISGDFKIHDISIERIKLTEKQEIAEKTGRGSTFDYQECMNELMEVFQLKEMVVA